MAELWPQALSNQQSPVTSSCCQDTVSTPGLLCHSVSCLSWSWGEGGQSIPDKSPGGHLTYMSLGLKCVCVVGEGRATCFSVSSNSPRQCANIIYVTGRVGLRRHLCSPLKWEESEVTNALPPPCPGRKGLPGGKRAFKCGDKSSPLDTRTPWASGHSCDFVFLGCEMLAQNRL